MGSWDNHRNAKPESRWERFTGSLGSGNRHRAAAWDGRGMDAVAGVRRKNTAPRPGRDMGSDRVTRSNRPTAEERKLEREAKAVERTGRANADTVQRLEEDIEKQRKILDDPKASASDKRRAKSAVERGRRTAKRVAKHTPDEYLPDNWKRR